MIKPRTGSTYTIPNGSTYLKVVKVKYSGETYCRAKIQFFTKFGNQLIDTTNNAKIYYENIQHWRRLGEN